MKGVDRESYEEEDAYTKVLYWFFAYPTKEVSLNNLVEAVNISKTSANKAVRRLVEEGFLRLKQLGRLWRITCNQEHEYNLTRKIPFNLQTVYQAGILEEVRKRIPNPRAVVLFGSYRKGDDTEESDIDIAAEVMDDEDLRILELGVLTTLGFRENVPVNLHVFSRNHVDLNLFANIANGIVLEGFLEVQP